MNEERNREMVRMHVEDRMTLLAIGQVVGLTGERVRQLVRQAGVTPAVSSALRSQRIMMRIREMSCEHCGVVFSFMPKKGTRRQFCSGGCARTAKRIHSNRGLLDYMKKLSLSLGRTPGKLDLDYHGPPCCTVYQHRFQSLRSAQIAAGLTPNKVGRAYKTLETTP